MKLRLKQDESIVNKYGNILTENIVIQAYDLHIDKDFQMTIKVGIFDASKVGYISKYEPLKVLTWVFSLEPKLPTYDVNGNMINTGHSGSAMIVHTMDILKPLGEPNIIVPRIIESQLWILAQPYDEINKIGDLFEFVGGLIVKDEPPIGEGDT